MHHLLFILAILSLSQAAILVRWAQAPVEVIGTWRLLIASLIMGLISLYSHKKFKSLDRTQWVWTVASGLFLFLHLWSYFFAAKNTLIANAVVLFAMNPIWTAVGMMLFYKQKINSKTMSALGLALVAIWIMFGDRFSVQSGLSIGDLSGLISAGLYSAYMLCSLKSRQLHIENKQFTFLIYAVCGLCFLTTGVIKNLAWLDYPMQTWLAILGMVIFPTLLGHALFTYLLKHFNLNWLSTGKLAEPVFSAIVAWLAFSEPLRQQTALSFILISASLMILFEPWKYLRGKNV